MPAILAALFCVISLKLFVINFLLVFEI